MVWKASAKMHSAQPTGSKQVMERWWQNHRLTVPLEWEGICLLGEAKDNAGHKSLNPCFKTGKIRLIWLDTPVMIRYLDLEHL